MRSLWISSGVLVWTVTLFQVLPHSQGNAIPSNATRMDMDMDMTNPESMTDGMPGAGTSSIKYCTYNMADPYYKACYVFCNMENSCINGENGNSYCSCSFPGINANQDTCFDPKFFKRMSMDEKKKCKANCRKLGQVANICTTDMTGQAFCVCMDSPKWASGNPKPMNDMMSTTTRRSVQIPTGASGNPPNGGNPGNGNQGGRKKCTTDMELQQQQMDDNNNNNKPTCTDSSCMPVLCSTLPSCAMGCGDQNPCMPNYNCYNPPSNQQQTTQKQKEYVTGLQKYFDTVYSLSVQFFQKWRQMMPPSMQNQNPSQG